MIYIAGRPMKDFTLDIRESGGAVTLRLDCRKDAEFWLELTLSDEDLYPFLCALFRKQVAKELGVEPEDVVLSGSPKDIRIVTRPVNPAGCVPQPSRN